MLELLDHSRSHHQWVLTDDRVIEYVHRAGFYIHSQLRWVRLDWSLLTALIYRWRPKTSMFHFRHDDIYTLGCGGAFRTRGRWSSRHKVRWQRLVHGVWPLRWLPLLEDFDACGAMSWGRAVLAFLYRELYKVAMMQTIQFQGHNTLLQVIRVKHFIYVSII